MKKVKITILQMMLNEDFAKECLHLVVRLGCLSQFIMNEGSSFNNAQNSKQNDYDN